MLVMILIAVQCNFYVTDEYHCQCRYHPGAERIVQRKLDCDGKHGDDQIPRRDGRSFAGGADGGSDGGRGDNRGCGFVGYSDGFCGDGYCGI